MGFDLVAQIATVCRVNQAVCLEDPALNPLSSRLARAVPEIARLRPSHVTDEGSDTTKGGNEVGHHQAARWGIGALVSVAPISLRPWR